MDDLKERLERSAHLAPLPSGDPLEGVRRRRARRDGLRRAGTAVVALGLAGASFAGIASLVQGSGGPGGGGRDNPLTAPPAVDASHLVVGPGQYHYELVVVILTDGQVGVEVETWWGPDDSGRRRVIRSVPGWGSGPRGVFGPGEFPYLEGDLSGLSTDPAELEVQLRERSAPGGASPQPDTTPDPGGDPMGGELWRAFDRLIELPNATPELRAALVRVMAGLEGSTVTAGEEDPVGRPAVRVSAEAFGLRLDAYVDPGTYQLLAFVRTDVPGTDADMRIWVAQGVVGSTDEVPTGDALLVPPPEDPLPQP